LAEHNRVALCCLRTPEEPHVNGALRERCDVVKEIVIPPIGASPADRWHYRLRVWTQVLAGKPLWAIGRSAAAFGEQVRALLQTWRPDIIQLEYHIMGQYLSALDGCPAPRVLIQHEPGQAAAREAWLFRQSRGLMMPYFDWLAWQCFERSIMRQVQAVVVFTERDRRTLAKLGPHTPVVRIPLGTDLPPHALNPLGTRPHTLLFVGSFLHPPNVDAALRLIDAIFPEVRARFPEARLYIVGSQPPREIERRANLNVVVTGLVPDVEPYLDQASLVVVPLRLGGGMRVKVLEAMAAGKAIVASPLAVEGLDLTDGEQVILAHSDRQFSEAISNLLSLPEQRAALAARAREWACANLHWDKVARSYEALYQSLL
jgi:glycosyltransferase involved in cell wall biosynthesis